VLLGYLPLNRKDWMRELNEKRNLYWEWRSDLLVNPRQSDEKGESAEVDDHPLNTSRSSQWNQFFLDNLTTQEIEKDVHRTYPHLHFFRNGQPEEDENGRILNNPHYQALRSILFLFTKLNPGIAYVQGMNEILGPIYYVFANDPNEEFKKHAEPDAFYCFTKLITEIRDNFIPVNDKTQCGIKHRIHQLNDLLREKDPELWHDLENKQLNPQFYSFRWLTLLLSQEFELPEVLRLWDTLFSDVHRFTHLLYVCVSMMITVREQLLKGDFADNLKLLQTYPCSDIIHILQFAKVVSTHHYKRSKEPTPEVPSETLTGNSATTWLESVFK